MSTSQIMFEKSTVQAFFMILVKKDELSLRLWISLSVIERSNYFISLVDYYGSSVRIWFFYCKYLCPYLSDTSRVLLIGIDLEVVSCKVCLSVSILVDHQFFGLPNFMNFVLMEPSSLLINEWKAHGCTLLWLYNEWKTQSISFA